jgi:hypothetical protein
MKVLNHVLRYRNCEKYRSAQEQRSWRWAFTGIGLGAWKAKTDLDPHFAFFSRRSHM